mmetsp:Transcript_2422/g.3481  ORF Transcript_2422/g.3481 Transcript_2422/m.3481 type:complete len:212 (-) Transcript_2422:711-1346(-)
MLRMIRNIKVSLELDILLRRLYRARGEQRDDVDVDLIELVFVFAESTEVATFSLTAWRVGFILVLSFRYSTSEELRISPLVPFTRMLTFGTLFCDDPTLRSSDGVRGISVVVLDSLLSSIFSSVGGAGAQFLSSSSISSERSRVAIGRNIFVDGVLLANNEVFPTGADIVTLVEGRGVDFGLSNRGPNGFSSFISASVTALLQAEIIAELM